MRSRVARAFAALCPIFLFAIAVSCSDRPLVTSPPSEIAAPVSVDVAAAVEFVAATSGATHNGTSLLLPVPAGIAEGDVLLAQIAVSGGGSVQAPADWTLIRADVTSGELAAHAFWKRATSAEPTSYDWRTSGSPVAGGIVAYRNVARTGSPVEAHAAQRTATGSSVVAPAVTVTEAGGVLVTLFSALADRKEKGLQFSPPGGLAERYDVSSSSPAANVRNAAAMHASTTVSSAGSTGTRVAQLSAARPAWGQTIALRAGTEPPPALNRAPVARAGGPYTAAEGSPINFNGTASSDPDGDALSWSWSFGGGLPEATAATATRTYVDNGSYPVRLTVSDGRGGTAVDSTIATISNAAPAAALSLSTASASTGQTITLTGTFSDAGTSDSPWAWEVEWGDGTKQSGTALQMTQQIVASRAYAAPGEYAIRLSVTDKDGGTGTAQSQVTVTLPGSTSVWYTDFSEYAVNAAPVGWSQPYSAGFYRVQERAGATGGKVLYGSTSSSAYHVLRWDAAGTPTDVEVEAVVRVASGSTYNEGMALVARGAAGTPTFYSSRLDSGTNLWTLARYNNGTSSALATWPNPFSAGTWVRHRFRVEGNALKVKLWAAGTAEPADWTLQGADPSPLGGGHAGVWLRRGSSANDYDWVRITVLGGGTTAPDPDVAWVWSGAQTPSGATVKTRLSSPSSNVRLRVSTDSLFGSYTETSPAATGGNNVATFQLTGYSPNARYFYRVVSGSTPAVQKQGVFRTLTAGGASFSFTFALGSCQITDTNSGVFNHIRAVNPLFWLQTGDIHYRNIATNDVDLFRTAYNRLHDQSNQAALFRAAPIVHIWDDHDGAGGNDTDATKTGWPAARAAYRENLPHYPLTTGSSGAIHHSFVVGRVRFIVSDLRSERSPVTQTDDAAKTMFGAAQKQHFKDQLLLARTNGEFIVWVSTIPWIAARTAGADHWGGYDTERQEIASYIRSIGVGSRMFMLSGDMHATAIDSGANNAWGGFPVFNAAPIAQTGSTKGGPYSHGPFTNGSIGEQFGTVAIVDNGGSTIQVSFSGRRNGSEIPGASHQFTLSLTTGN